MKELKHIAFQLNVLIEDYYRNQEETEDREVEGIQNTQMENPINKMMDDEAIKMAKKIDEEKYDFVKKMDIRGYREFRNFYQIINDEYLPNYSCGNEEIVQRQRVFRDQPEEIPLDQPEVDEQIKEDK